MLLKRRSVQAFRFSLQHSKLAYTKAVSQLTEVQGTTDMPLALALLPLWLMNACLLVALYGFLVSAVSGIVFCFGAHRGVVSRLPHGLGIEKAPH